MKVYVAVGGWAYDTAEPIGVFTTQEEAMDVAKEWDKQSLGAFAYVQPFEVGVSGPAGDEVFA